MCAMSNLHDLASLLIRNQSSTYEFQRTVETTFAANPLLPFVVVEFTYTHELGSDGCWDRTETGVCTLREWLDGSAVNRCRVGNRSYNFQISKIMDSDETSCAAAKAAHEKRVAAHMEAARKLAQEQREAAVAAAIALDNAKAKFLGKNVTSKKVSGTVKRVIHSKFGTGIVAQVADKWLDINKLTLV